MRTKLTHGKVETPLGTMDAIADSERLYLLEFCDTEGAKRRFFAQTAKLELAISSGTSALLRLLEQQLQEYFSKKATRFSLPFEALGSSFQKKAWRALERIPFGEVRSYGQQAAMLSLPGAARAVGTANSANPLTLIIPCHRVVRKGGAVGGYAGGAERKEWLLRHEGST